MATDRHERAVLAGMTRALLDSGARCVALPAIFEGCNRALPVPVILEVLERLAAAGLVRPAGAAAGVVQLVQAGAGRAASAAPPPAAEAGYVITEAGFLAHVKAAEAEAQALAAELPGLLAGAGIGQAERDLWAELHDYLSWRPDRTVHLGNFGLGRKLRAEALRRFQDSLLRLGLLERTRAETHFRLTELGRRMPRLPR